MVVLVGVGVMRLFDAYPLSLQALTVFSVGYLLYMAYRIATAAPSLSRAATGSGRPMTFFQAALYQWINPKSWSMAVTATTVYSPSRDLDAIVAVAAVFGLVALPCITVWAVMGQNLKRFLGTNRRLRQFNWLMATSLVASLIPVLSSY